MSSPLSVTARLLFALLIPWVGHAHAQQALDPWRLCPSPPESPPLPPTGGGTHITADQAEAQGERGHEVSIFRGNVVAERDGRRIAADQVEYDTAADMVNAHGAVQINAEGMRLQGSRARIDLANDVGELEDASYYMRDAHAYGEARSLEFEGATGAELRDATYTTCPPGQKDWTMHARVITLDRTSNTGEAYDVTLRFGSVPALYLPYINFPLEGRKSGFLAPSYASSERNGVDLSVPWYWNIAPNRDATLTPRIITERGAMLMTEYRHLTASSMSTVTIDYLPGDKMFGADRSQFTLHHLQQLTPRWHLALNYNEVSDDQYLDDIDNTLASASATHLERRLDLTYSAPSWRFLGRVQDFQPLVAGSEPYQLRPQLVASGAGVLSALRYDFRTEYSQFVHDTRKPTGARFDVYPALSTPMEGNWWFITPRLSVRYTQYLLEDAGDNNERSRTLPLASLDSGLFFERELSMFDHPLVQTLEPRLFYLYVPFKAQDNLPVFDTTPMTFSFAQLFRENRYTGPDRVSDANQVTAAVSSRFLSRTTGRELARAGIAQTYYIRRPRVTLPGEAAVERTYSDIAGELAASPIPYLEISATTRWDPELDDAQETAARLRYSPDQLHVVDAAYRVRENGRVMNRDVLVVWPITRHWHALGRWYYDLVAERTLESVVGIEYESCCWTVRLVARDRPVLTAAGDLEPDRSFHFTFELKGLARLGQPLESVIEDGLVGYR